MVLSVLQLNINSDNYWDKLTAYLMSHDFDVLLLQEMTGKNTIIGNIHAKHDTFIALQKLLKDKYLGELSIGQRFTSSPDSYMGNAIFYKKDFTLLSKKEVKFTKSESVFPADATSYEKIGRTLLHLHLGIAGKKLSLLTTHFAWANNPLEHPHQTKQGKILIDYLKTVQTPFLLSGDFNLEPDQPLIKKLNTIARNLTTENHIKNTLNPRTHRVKTLFPKGLAIDYIFISNDIIVKQFATIEDDLSDHFGLSTKIEL